MLRIILRALLWLLLALAVLLAIGTWRNWDTVQRVFLGGKHTHETVPPALPAALPRPAVLVFSKTNAFRHGEAIAAAANLFDRMARGHGWGLFQTENGAVFRDDILQRFDAVVFSNASGDLLDAGQQAALQRFLERGGGFVGLHAAGDNSHAGWPWYMDKVIGTTFIGHPMKPQFQQATVRVEDRTHPATQHLPPAWVRTDEWYSFDRSPRGTPGVTVLASLDERTYRPVGMFGQKLAMGDHPIIWSRCVGRGRVFYSALGHSAAAFAEPAHIAVLQHAIGWAMRQQGKGCDPRP